MTKPLLICVMAHGDAQATFDRHLPLWERYNAPIVVVAPADNPVVTKHTLWLIGRKCHAGAEAIARFREMLGRLWATDYETTVFFEYDAIGLSDTLPACVRSICGNVFRDDGPGRGFVGTTFIHPPVIFSRDALDRLIQVMPRYGDDVEFGFWDRWLGLICEQEGIPLMNLMPNHGHANNTIEGSLIDHATEAAGKGVSLYHGVKNADVLSALVKAYVPHK